MNVINHNLTRNCKVFMIIPLLSTQELRIVSYINYIAYMLKCTCDSSAFSIDLEYIDFK